MWSFFLETAIAVDQAKAQSSSAAVAPVSSAAAVIAEVIATPEQAAGGGLPEAAERPVSATIEGSQTVMAEVARAQMVHHQSSSQRYRG